MKPEFLYVQWQTAKLKLAEELFENNDKRQIFNIVERFFLNHVFEVGTDFHVDEHYYRELGHKKGFQEETNRKCLHFLADEILKKGLYMQTPYSYNQWEFRYTTQFTTLVLGTPKMIGPTTRKL